MIRVVGQKTQGDCTIAALAMFLGCAYSTVLKVAETCTPNPATEGMYISKILMVAKKLGVKLKKGRYSPNKKEGILSVTNHAKGWKTKGRLEDHVVVIWNGLIIDPTGPYVWEPKQYARCCKSKFGAMLTLA